ncbi:MAG: porin family protein [Mesorhizobium sp.]|nr:MAG: porin family protein [Mesorhizobium sp.]
MSELLKERGIHMIRNLLASVFVFGCAATASAADVVVESGAAAYNWSGVYVGGALGYESLEANDVTFGDGWADDGGFSGAIYGGYNYQYANWVFGVEGDVKFGNAEVNDGDFLLPLESRVAGSIRGRVGYAFDNIMPYVTGGLAIGSFRADHEGDGDSDDFATETLTGYTVGGGIEWGATENLVVRAEYLFSDYGKNDFTFYDNDVHEIEVRTHDVRIGLAYKF